MNFKEIQELIKIVDESNLTTVEVEQEGFKIVLKKKVEKIVVAERTDSAYPGQLSPGQISASQGLPDGMTSGKAHQITDQEPENYETIKSPIVGTFYSSSAPGDPPFVSPGAKADKGSTLCIIEAMKLMNEIEAEEDVLILEVLVQDGQMVEYGQPLFKISK
ncbi:MAG: hypothetical protein APF84_19565 [Gracilibacter sp. BRH_c7a]|nr:MAG: hypothetical protein APF84_19565 [Gracilibacter sp. BRH_c7a]